MEFYLHFNLDMGRSPGFGSNTTDFMRPVQTRSRCGSGPQVLNLASYIHSPDHSTKGTRSPVDGLSVLVSTRFQVLFHSPPGVLFTFPSQYSSLSVRVVPPYSHRVSRVRRYSGYSSLTSNFAYVTLTLFRRPSHAVLLSVVNAKCCPNPGSITTSGLASSAFARHYSRNLG